MSCDALIVSDLHLGNKRKARPKAVRAFFDAMSSRQLTHQPERVILNGDVLDDLDFRKWPNSHWDALAAIRKAAEVIPTVWVVGNHDGSPVAVSAIAGARVQVEAVSASFTTGGLSFVAAHGHDKSVFSPKSGGGERSGLTRAEVLKKLSDQWVYKRSKIMEAVNIARGAVTHARESGHAGIVCGHTHGAFSGVLGDVRYANSGSWTSGQPATYVVANEGRLELHAFAPPQQEAVP